MSKAGSDCVLAEMFYSMGPAGMASSVTSVRSGSEMSESSMDSSTHSLSFTQPAALTPQVQHACSRTSQQIIVLNASIFQWFQFSILRRVTMSFWSQGMVTCPRRYPVAGCLSSLPQASGWTKSKATTESSTVVEVVVSSTFWHQTCLFLRVN